MNSRDYWAEREAEQLQHYITDEAEYDKQLRQIYNNMLDGVQQQINAFYGKYAATEGITIAEAKKRVSKLDIAEYERKAKRYVRDKDFSDQANEEMRLYNLTMKVNRLEMLKANIGLELIAGHDELEKFMDGILKGRTEEELQRQAGILGKTVLHNAAKAKAIVNSSFHNARFSDRIWMYQDVLRADLSRILQTGLIQGKNPRALAREIREKFNATRYNAERLMRTELARVQTEAQKQSFIRNGFDMYEFICNHHASKHGTCDICQGLDGKHFKVKDMMPGENAPPMHPHCRCSTAAWVDDKEYDAWLDFLANGGTTEEWEKQKNKPAEKPKRKAKPKAEKAPEKAAPGKLDVSNFPDAFTKGAERKNTQKFVDFVNSIPGANAATMKLYNCMGKLESIVSKGIPFKISHGKNHAIQSRMYYNGVLTDVKLIIPKLSGENLAGQINTTLHENMHLLDMFCRRDTSKYGDWFSSSRASLVDVFKNSSPGMSGDVSALFTQFKAEYKATRDSVYSSYTQKRADLRESYFPNGQSIWSDIDKYRLYEKEAKKLEKWYEEELDYQCRNIMGGGVNALQDIYDALSGGAYRDDGTVLYGHGSKYYRSTDNRVQETLANYGALSVARPDLIEMLRADKPELVAELEATVEAMIEKAGE